MTGRHLVALGLAGVSVLFLVACAGARALQPQAPTVPPAPPSAPDARAERLFLLDGDGLHELIGDQRKLVFSPPGGAFIYDAVVSPDGTDVALALQPPPRQTPGGYDFGIDLYVARDGGEAVPVAVHSRIAETMSRPVWLPGGDSLLFAVFGRDETGAVDLRIERIDLITGVRERYVEDAIEPALSSDGGRLAYVRYDPQSGAEVIMIMELATGVSRPLLSERQRMSNVANLAWSPDGARLAFASADPLTLLAPGGGFRAAVVHPSLRDVWLVNLYGTDLHRITELADSTLSLAWAADNRHLYAAGDTGFWRLDSTDGEMEVIGAPATASRVQTLFP